MARATSSGSIRRLVRSARAAHRRQSQEWIRRIEAPADEADPRR
jgi:hypothetical protein